MSSPTMPNKPTKSLSMRRKRNRAPMTFYTLNEKEVIIRLWKETTPSLNRAPSLNESQVSIRDWKSAYHWWFTHQNDPNLVQRFRSESAASSEPQMPVVGNTKKEADALRVASSKARKKLYSMMEKANETLQERGEAPGLVRAMEQAIDTQKTLTKEDKFRKTNAKRDGVPYHRKSDIQNLSVIKKRDSILHFRHSMCEPRPDLLDLVGLPGSRRLFKLGDAVYAKDQTSFLEEPGTNLPSVICEFTNLNRGYQYDVTAKLAKADSYQVNADGFLFNLYFIDKAPNPLWFYCQPRSSTSMSVFMPEQSVHSVGKVVASGAIGWRRYKTWRSFVRAEAERGRRFE